MKFLSAIILFIISNNLNAQQTTSIDLRITIAKDLDVPNEATLTLNYFDNRNSNNNLLKVSGREIYFNKAEKEPVLAELTLVWPNKKKIRTQFLLPIDSGTISIDAYNKLNIVFKNQQKLYRDFSSMNSEVERLQQTSNTKIKTVNFENRKMDDVQKEIDSLYNYYERVIDHTIYKNIIDRDKNSFIGVIALIKYAERPSSHQRRKFQADSLLTEYDMFSKAMQNLPSMQAFHKLLFAEKQIETGGSFPIFKLKDTLNQSRDISKLYGNKYTLIDIWANWCVPCREEHPNLIVQYEKYKKSGFQLISISTDKLKDSYLWKEAIKNDNVGLWPHFNDSEEKTRDQLKIRFIPANFLLDDKGIIIGKYLRGEELNEKLKSLYGF